MYLANLTHPATRVGLLNLGHSKSTGTLEQHCGKRNICIYCLIPTVCVGHGFCRKKVICGSRQRRTAATKSPPMARVERRLVQIYLKSIELYRRSIKEWPCCQGDKCKCRQGPTQGNILAVFSSRVIHVSRD